MTKIAVSVAADGTPTHLVPLPPSALPPVFSRDIRIAWEAAHEAAAQARWGAQRRFCFVDAAGAPTELAIADDDAGCWVAAVERRIGLDTLRGISACLRLLALIDLLTAAPFAGLAAISRGEATLPGPLVRLAAEAPLNDDALFDPARFAAGLGLLPREHAACDAF